MEPVELETIMRNRAGNGSAGNSQNPSGMEQSMDTFTAGYDKQIETVKFVSGDTVFRDRWHTEYRDRLVRDTVNITDSVRVEVPYPVEKELTRWQRFKMDVGGIAAGAVLILLAGMLWKRRK